MKLSWTKGLDKERTNDVKSNFSQALVLRKRLTEILNEKTKESQRVNRSKANYENPNWAYLQADCSGYERALQEIIELLE